MGVSNMNSVKSKIRSISPNKKKMFKFITAFILIIFVTTTVSAAVSKHDTVLPENPLNEIANNSNVPLKGNYKDFIHLESNSNEAEEKNEEENEEEQEETNEQENEQNSEHANKEQDQSEDNIDTDKGMDTDNDKATDSGDKRGSFHDSSKDGNQPKGDGGSNNDEFDSANLEITGNDELDKNDYFTTSIKNKEVVADADYSFSITQLEHDFRVKDVHVTAETEQTTIDSITGEQNKQVNVQSQLTEGDNHLRVSVTYEDEEKETFTVAKDYVVTLKEDDIIIHTDLEDQEVYNETLSFKASAEKGEKSVPVTVTVNDEDISGDDKRYQAILLEGNNEIIITAQDGDDSLTETFTVYYEEPSLTIQTDLENQTVSDPELSFSAKAFNGDTEIDLSITLNGEQIKTNNEGKYTITLKENENTIELYAEKGSQSHSETFTIHYTTNPTEDGDEEDDPHAPTIEIHDLDDGQTLKGTTKTFHVSAKDYNGDYISSIQVTNNNENVNNDWVNDNQTSFTLKVKDGENNIVVTATDGEGNTATKSLTVHGDISDGVIGHATISLEATTIGLGHIIPAEEVEIYQGETGANVIDRLFEKYGITYDYTGSHENSFYLEAIYREGLVANPSIPSDLYELLERDADRLDPEGYHDPDSLGEFDFTNGSGWMYSVNGNYPNVGFADYYFEEGDVVRIRFTLALGSDIGGGRPGTNYNKEW